MLKVGVTCSNQCAVKTYGKYEGGSKTFRTDQLFKVIEIKQLCYFSI